MRYFVDIDKLYRILDKATVKNYPSDRYDENGVSFYEGMLEALRIVEEVEPDLTMITDEDKKENK